MKKLEQNGIQWFLFLSDLFYLDSDVILRELDNQPEFITGRRLLNDIHTAGDTVLIGASESKLMNAQTRKLKEEEKGNKNKLTIKSERRTWLLVKGTNQLVCCI